MEVSKKLPLVYLLMSTSIFAAKPDALNCSCIDNESWTNAMAKLSCLDGSNAFKSSSEPGRWDFKSYAFAESTGGLCVILGIEDDETPVCITSETQSVSLGNGACINGLADQYSIQTNEVRDCEAALRAMQKVARQLPDCPPDSGSGTDYQSTVHPIWDAQTCSSGGCHDSNHLNLNLSGDAASTCPNVTSRLDDPLCTSSGSAIISVPSSGTLPNNFAHPGGVDSCFQSGGSCRSAVLDWCVAGADCP